MAEWRQALIDDANAVRADNVLREQKNEAIVINTEARQSPDAMWRPHSGRIVWNKQTKRFAAVNLLTDKAHINLLENQVEQALQMLDIADSDWLGQTMKTQI